MKRLSVLLSLAVFFLALSACSAGIPIKSSGSPTPDQGPQISFSSPAPGASVPLGPVQVILLSEDPLGTAQVEILVNGESAATIQSPDSSRSAVVIEYGWQPSAAGKYVLQAHGQNTAGTWGAFASVEVTVAESGAAEPATPTEEAPATEAPTEILPTATKSQTPVMGTPEPTPTTNSGITLTWALSFTQMYVADAPCGTTTNMATATISPADSAYSVLLFFRIGNKAGTEFRPWTKGLALGPNGPGKFYILFTTRHIALPVPWVPAQVWYQFVAINKTGAALYRTPVYTNLAIINCP
jgi:hypothetical protein